jgi:hypothetical protein
MATHTHIEASILNRALEGKFMCVEGASLMNRKACTYLFIYKDCGLQRCSNGVEIRQQRNRGSNPMVSMEKDMTNRQILPLKTTAHVGVSRKDSIEVARNKLVRTDWKLYG